MVTEYNIVTLLELSGFQVKNSFPLFRIQAFPLPRPRHVIPCNIQILGTGLKCRSWSPPCTPENSAIQCIIHFQNFRALNCLNRGTLSWLVSSLMVVAFFSLCNFLCTCHQNTKPRWVSVSEDEFVPFSFLGIASSGRSKTKIHLANYESDILGELSDMAFILTYHTDIITSHRQGAQTAAGLAHLIPWKWLGPIELPLFTIQFNKVSLTALGWLPPLGQKPGGAVH